jgi:hypothetical protein
MRQRRRRCPAAAWLAWSVETGCSARRSAASSPVSVTTSKRFSCARPSQICLPGLTRMTEVIVWPGATSCGGVSKPNCSSESGSWPSRATITGALALFSTATPKSALRRPLTRSGLTFVVVSVYGSMLSVNASDATSVLCALEFATTFSSQVLATASGERGGWKWISTSCS